MASCNRYLWKPQIRGSFTIIAGERRVRAARVAGFASIPVIVRQFSDGEKLEIALVENIQREDLTPIEEAAAYRRLMDLASLSQDEIATQVGKDRSTVANSLRLLKLPEEMRQALDEGDMSAGHARAILMVVNPSDQQVLFSKVILKRIVGAGSGGIGRSLNRGKKSHSKRNAWSRRLSRDPTFVRQIEDELIEKLGTKVEVKGTASKGKYQISYFSSDDLERILEILIELTFGAAACWSP